MFFPFLQFRFKNNIFFVIFCQFELVFVEECEGKEKRTRVRIVTSIEDDADEDPKNIVDKKAVSRRSS